MSYLHVRIERHHLPTPDLVVVNHPTAGVVLIADHRVSDAAIGAFVQVLSARAVVHRDRIPPASLRRGRPRTARPGTVHIPVPEAALQLEPVVPVVPVVIS